MTEVDYSRFNITADSLGLSIECHVTDNCYWYRRGESPINLHAFMDSAKHHYDEKHRSDS